MARFAATFSITETTDWEAADFFRFDEFRDQVGQNLEYFAQTHDHSGDAGDGATLTAGDDGLLFFAMPASE